MSAAMEVVLLERIESLGKMGDVVRVKPGYARNFLLPQKKALRATKDNLAYFETQRAALEKLNAEKKKDAEQRTKTLHGLKVVLVRHAAEGGQLYGSVSARDIAEAITEQGGQEVGRNQVQLNLGIKTIGLFNVTVALHPEVKVDVSVNIARTEEEAKVQAKTGKAVIAEGYGGQGSLEELDVAASKKAMLDDSALANEQEAGAEEAGDAEEAATRAEKAAKRAAKKKAKSADTEGDDSEESEEDEE